MDDSLNTIKEWLQPYGLTCTIENGLVYKMVSVFNFRRYKLFPLNQNGLIDLCQYAKWINQDIYRELPEFLTKKG